MLKTRWIKKGLNCHCCSIKMNERPLDSWGTPRVHYDEDAGKVLGIVCGRCYLVLRTIHGAPMLSHAAKYAARSALKSTGFTPEKDAWLDKEEDIK